MEIKTFNDEIKSALQVGANEAQPPLEEQVYNNSEAKERDEKGPWTLWSDLKPTTTKCSCTCECPEPNESELLTDILIRYGNNPEDLPALHYAILQKDIVAVELLLKHGASPFTMSRGNNCLYFAIKAGSLPLVKKFIDLRVSVERVYGDDLDALWVARTFNQTEIIKYLESLNSPPSIEVEPPSPPTPPSPSELEQLTLINVKYGNNPEGISALHYAILKKDISAVDLLLKYGASPFTKDTQGNNGFYYAIKAGSLELVKKFIDLGLNPNSFTGAKTPIHIAILNHQNDIARYLINYGVRINFEDLDVDAGLDCLIDCASVGNSEIYDILLKRGVKCNNQIFFINTLMQVSEEKNRKKRIEMFEHLLDLHIIGPNDLLDYGPLLHYAVKPEYGVDLINVLLKKGANANAISIYGSLNVFFLGGLLNESNKYFENQKAMIKLLIQYGADINHKDKSGNTPLSYAHGERMIAFLKSLGAR